MPITYVELTRHGIENVEKFGHGHARAWLDCKDTAEAFAALGSRGSHSVLT